MIRSITDMTVKLSYIKSSYCRSPVKRLPSCYYGKIMLQIILTRPSPFCPDEDNDHKNKTFSSMSSSASSPRIPIIVVKILCSPRNSNHPTGITTNNNNSYNNTKQRKGLARLAAFCLFCSCCCPRTIPFHEPRTINKPTRVVITNHT
jgi:hypothetical protein